MLHKRIAVIMGKVYKAINSQQLCGILEQAYAHGFQVMVFTLGEEYSNERIIQGELNIMNLIRFSEFDGIIYLPYTFSKPLYWESISQFLNKYCTIPVIKIASETDEFISLWHDEKQEAYEVVTHLLKEHGCRRLHFLTGPKDMLVSMNRLEGYREAMEQAGLTFSEQIITYGDFWIYKAQELAEEFISGSRELPDAVVCGNDTMAIALCDALMEKGISVPQDVKIMGYDGTLEAAIHSPSISTYHTSWAQLGRTAVCMLYEAVTGEKMEPVLMEYGVSLYRESCGCPKPEASPETAGFNYQQVEENYLDNNLSTQLHTATNLDDFLRHVIDNVFIFFDTVHYEKQGFYLCLCEDWNKIEMRGYSNQYRTEGYSERMIMYHAGDRMEFSSSEMIPSVLKEKQRSVIFVNPVHFQERCFGYAIFQFENYIAGYNIHYHRFLRELNNGLEFLCVQNEARSLAFRNYVSNIRDSLTGLYKPEGGDQLWQECCEQADSMGELVYMVGITLGNFNRLSDAAGVLASEKFLVDFAEMLLGCCKNGEKCIRCGEHEFLLLGRETTPFMLHERLQETIHKRFKQMTAKLGLIEHLVLHSTQFITNTGDTYTAAAQKTKEKLQMLIDKTYPHPVYYFDLQKIRKALYACPEEEWTLERCASQLNISPPYFQKLYRETFHVNWIHDMKAGKLLYAVSLLVSTDDKLELIAEKCGYDYSHFMRSFKKHFGMTPKEFRKSPIKRVTTELF